MLSHRQGSSAIPVSRRTRAPLTVFLLALAVRLVCLIQVADAPMYRVLIVDAKAYDEWAERIAAGDWLGDEVFYQAPLYPYFLGTLYSVFRTDDGAPDRFTVRIAQVVLGATGCALVASAGAVWFGRRGGMVAGAMLALYPPAIFFDLILQKASLGFLWMALLLYLLSRTQQRLAIGRLVCVGAVLGLFALTREHALLLACLIPLWLWIGFRRVSASRRLAAVAALVAGMATVLLPPAWRNYAVGGEFVLTTSQYGPNFYIGNHAGATGLDAPLIPGRNTPEFERADAWFLAESDLGRPLTAKEVSDYWTRRTFADIREDPLAWMRLMARKWFLTWNAEEFSDAEDLDTYAEYSTVLSALKLPLHFGTVVPLAAFGAAVTWRRRRRVTLLYAMAGVVAVGVCFFHVFARYRFPLVPIAALFAGAGVVHVWSLIRRRRGSAVEGLVALIIAAVACNWPIVRGYDSRIATYYNLGTVFTEQSQLDQAVAMFQRTLSLDSNNAEAHSALGETLRKLGLSVEARAEIERALRINPDLPSAHRNLGVLLAEGGDHVAALAQYDAALQWTPHSVFLRYFRAVSLEALGRDDEALDEYAAAVRYQSDFAEAHLARALIFRRMNRPAEAEQSLRKAIKVAPEFVRALRALADLLAELGREEEADAYRREAARPTDVPTPSSSDNTAP